jgi:hypothetical protein
MMPTTGWRQLLLLLLLCVSRCYCGRLLLLLLLLPFLLCIEFSAHASTCSVIIFYVRGEARWPCSTAPRKLRSGYSDSGNKHEGNKYV